VQVLLVVVLGVPERGVVGDLGGDRSVAGGGELALIGVAAGLRRLALHVVAHADP
jgi:hypothetical protein